MGNSQGLTPRLHILPSFYTDLSIRMSNQHLKFKYPKWFFPSSWHQIVLHSYSSQSHLVVILPFSSFWLDILVTILTDPMISLLTIGHHEKILLVLSQNIQESSHFSAPWPKCPSSLLDDHSTVLIVHFSCTFVHHIIFLTQQPMWFFMNPCHSSDQNSKGIHFIWRKSPQISCRWTFTCHLCAFPLVHSTPALEWALLDHTWHIPLQLFTLGGPLPPVLCAR